MIETIQADWIKSEAINLENCCNDNPLKILGPHFYEEQWVVRVWMPEACLLYTSPSPRDRQKSRMPSSA